jgi:adenylate cyclase
MSIPLVRNDSSNGIYMLDDENQLEIYRDQTVYSKKFRSLKLNQITRIFKYINLINCYFHDLTDFKNGEFPN